MKFLTALAAIALALPAAAGAQSSAGEANQASTAVIDAEVWSAISKSVVEQDIIAMAETYHPDAVVVTTGGTVRASEQLPKWGKDMETAKMRGASATVAFRFSRRLDNADTAFEVGMFKYTVTDSAGTSTAYHIPMEALLVRHQGGWRVLMERQFAAVGTSEWNSLTP